MEPYGPGPLGRAAGYMLLVFFPFAIALFAKRLVVGFRNGTISIGSWRFTRGREDAKFWMTAVLLGAGLFASGYTLFNILRRLGWIA